MASLRVRSGEVNDVVAKRLRVADIVVPHGSLSNSEFNSRSILNFPQGSRNVPAIEHSKEMQVALHNDSITEFAASNENESAQADVVPKVLLPNCSLLVGSFQSSTESDTDHDADCNRGEASRRRFVPHSHDEMQIVNEGGRRRSKHGENWSRSTFHEWRVEQKVDTSLSIEKLSEQEDLKPFDDLLARFILDARKRDGSFYPPGSINSLLRGIGRIIRACCNKRAIESSKPCELFHIFSDVISTSKIGW